MNPVDPDKLGAWSGQNSAASGERSPFAAVPPSLSLPKGGGAIRSIGEKFAASPVTGTGSMSVPIATSPGRSGFQPQLALSYDSGAGNGPFGFGWSLSLPSITRKTDKGLPQYLDVEDSDVFVLSGAEDLVPVFRQDDNGAWVTAHPDFRRDARGGWVHDPLNRLVVHEDEIEGFRVRRYRPRIEGLFARIERWSRIGSPDDIHWRSISKDNVLTLYGFDANSRIADPLDPSRIFSWLICESRDDKGNGIRYLYKPEDGTWQCRPGQADPFGQAHQRNRGMAGDVRRTAQRYLQRVLYGNVAPLLEDDGQRPRHLTHLPHPPADNGAHWLFEVRFDYGELHDGDPGAQPEQAWLYRPDAFSSYRAGFEIRTCRRCKRVLMLHHVPDQPQAPPQGPAAGYRGVVRSTEFIYDDNIAPDFATQPVYSFLKQVVQTGWNQEEGGRSSRRSLPPLQFDYSEPIVQDVVAAVDSQSMQNLPTGLDGTLYRWVDLHGEGLPGILTEQAGAWYYKRNLSPLPTKLPGGNEVVKARFAAVDIVASKPNVALGAGAEFMDLAGDGRPDVVVMAGTAPGLYEHDAAEGWQPFRAFASHLHRDWRDPNLKLIDLDGDGRADVLITEDDALVWHASMAEEGFQPARRTAQALDEERGPCIVLADATQSIHLADLSGDGLTDIVRIRNGEVCYWPNLGYGRFGAKVTMDNAPWFDNPGQFDHQRLRLADIDGSGTTDLVYLHRDGVRLYFNQSGNSWSQPRTLKVFPREDELVNIVLADLLGNGTACLVWSSTAPADSGRPMQYANLMGGRKPHLLTRVANNLGTETIVEYASSLRFYLQDKQAGRPWMSRLPFPVHVVERVTTLDHISRSRFITRYAYHHGCFDGEEREFRGFGMVEQWDTEQFAAFGAGQGPAFGTDAASHVPPVHTKTWFHTGVGIGCETVARHYENEYFREPGLTIGTARAFLLHDTGVPRCLTPEEEREACRALKGSMLRQEVYADDAEHPGASPRQTERARTPYTVTEHSFDIRVLQRRGSNRHAVFFPHARETLSFHYERNPTDPRIQHVMTLEVDEVGNVLKQAAIGYGRRASPLATQWDQHRQTTPLLTYTENRLTNAIAARDAHRTPLPCEAITFELTGYPPTGDGGRFRAADFVEPDPTRAGRLRHRFNAPEVSYEATATGVMRRRPIEWLRTLYRRDDLHGLLPLGELQPLALPGESYRLAFTPGLLEQVFKRPRPGQPDEALLPDLAGVLSGQGGYLTSQALKADGRFPTHDADGHWWIPSGRSFYSTDSADDAAAELGRARRHFFVTRRYRDPFGQDACVEFDAHDLLMTQTRDALGNCVTVESHDYRVLQPRRVSDPNRNQTAVAFDCLGMVVGTAVMGKPPPAPAEGDTLDGFEADLTAAQLDSFLGGADTRAVAAALLGDATTRIVYDLDRFRRLGEPPFAAVIARETHVSELRPGQTSQLQISFGYSDGFGREIQRKTQAEPGPLDVNDPQAAVVNPRWVGSGWTVFNNKGKPVRQYEPFFSATHGYEFGVMAGVSPVLFYDPAERVVATLHPNHTYEKVVFDPWQQTTWDVNDTCAPRHAQSGDPRNDPDIGGYVAGYFSAQPSSWQTWRAQRLDGALGVDEQQAAQRAAAHADTPSITHFDTLGRPFLTLAHNRVVCSGHDLDGSEALLATRIELDIEGNQRAVRDAIEQAGDPLGRITMRYAHDLLGNRIHQLSMEAGARWTLNDVAGKPMRAWDGRGHDVATRYDALRRPVSQTVRGTSTESDPRTLGRDVLIERIEYGEGAADCEALNLRTRIFRHFDPAGVATNARLDAHGDLVEAYDFKGNLLCATRQLASDYTAVVDWLLAPELEAERFEGRTRYDALNRPVQSIAPRSNAGRGSFNVIQPVFNEANLLERVDVWLERAADPGALLDPADEAASPVGVARIDYDANGQRLRIDYKNGVRTAYRYDPLTFRLTRLLTRRHAADFPGDDPWPPVAGWPGRQVQNLRYTYDPAGNISHIQDDAQQTIYFRNRRVDPSNDYTYDAIYRLIQATGREHLGQGGTPMPHSHDDAGRVGLASADASGRFAPNDGNAMGAYIERYVYDAVGNFLQMQHRGSDPAHAGWTRAYGYIETSLTEHGSGGVPRKTSNRLSRTTLNPTGPSPLPEAYAYDAHGNMVRMPHLGGSLPGPNMHWDFKDQLRQADLGGGGRAFYVYDASGQRVRKVWEKAPGLIEERIYFGGFEVFRRHGGPIGAATATLERETLQVMDGKQRVALVETCTLDAADDDPAPRRLIRYQFGNHLGSASLELDERAQIISYEEFSPYGSSTYQAVRSQTETAKRYRFTGMEKDEETGLEYHSARYYSPWLGVWSNCDPVEMDGGAAHRYRYVHNRATRKVDINGKWDIDWGEAALGFAVAAAGVAVVVATAGIAGPAIVAGAATVLGVSEATVVTGIAVAGTAAGIVGTAETTNQIVNGVDASGNALNDAQRSRALGRLPVEAVATLVGARGISSGGPPANFSFSNPFRQLAALGPSASGSSISITIPTPIATPGAAISGISSVAAHGTGVLMSMASGEGGSGSSDEGDRSLQGQTSRSHPNQLPEQLPEELAEAQRLGVRPVQPSDPGFEDIANSGRIKWAITEEGELRVIPHTVEGTEIAHTVLTQGRPVLAAGEAEIAISGELKVGAEITPRSGHFLNGSDSATNASVLDLGRAAFKRFGIEFPR